MGKYTVRQFWRLVGPLFGTRSRRRVALVSCRLNIFACGFVLRPRHEVYSTNPVEFRCQNHPCQSWDSLFYYNYVALGHFTERPPHNYSFVFFMYNVYDDARERIVLTLEKNKNFTRNLSKFPKRRIVTARILFYDLLASVET